MHEWRWILIGTCLGVCSTSFWVRAEEPRAEVSSPSPKWPTPVPQNVPIVKYTEARQLLKKRKWAEAVIVLRSALRDRPAYLPVELDLVRALTFLGRREEALQILEGIVQRERGDRRRRAIERIQVISKTFLKNATYQTYQEGLNSMRSAQFETAKDKFSGALKNEPDNVEVLVRLGQCVVLQGDYDTASEYLQKAKQLNPYEEEVRLWLGRSFFHRGQLKQSLVELQEARKKLEDEELSAVWLAEALLESGRRTEALELLEDDLKKRPMHLLSLVTLARIRFSESAEDPKKLWETRKVLQLAMSRFDRYREKITLFAGELGYRPVPAPSLKQEIASLMRKVESKLESVKSKPIGREDS